jgi:excisionase family DNA binding protein
VAKYLQVPIKTLDQWAHKRVGPPYKIIGRHARYDWDRVDEWVDAQQSGGDAA